MQVPIEYDESLFDLILDRISNGESRYKIFSSGEEGVGVPIQRFHSRLRADHDYYTRYQEAIEFSTDAMTNSIIEIADTTNDVLRGKLQIDARKFAITRYDMLKQNRLMNKDEKKGLASELFNTDDMDSEDRELFMCLLQSRLRKINKKED